MATVNTGWTVEDIPDSDGLYLRVHQVNIRNGELRPGAFRDHEGGMSTDWEKYSTPAETRARTRDPEKNGVVKLISGDVRNILLLSVVHEPLPDNRAHTEVFGDKKAPEVRVKLGRIAKFVIPIAVKQIEGSRLP